MPEDLPHLLLQVDPNTFLVWQQYPKASIECYILRELRFNEAEIAGRGSEFCNVPCLVWLILLKGWT